jgi:hypothetical protein
MNRVLEVESAGFPRAPHHLQSPRSHEQVPDGLIRIKGMEFAK